MTQDPTSLERLFFAWVDRVLPSTIPVHTVAYHFNLYEGMSSVHVQLTGTNSFQPGEVPEQDYWPGEPTFSTEEDVFEVPFSSAGANWKQWLEKSKGLVLAYLSCGSRSAILKQSQGVSIGFVDGDMHILWRPGGPIV
jgi:hypothetical protein